MKKTNNITATLELKDIKPAKNKILIKIKSWPSQFSNGIFVPESNVIIRNELYITECVAVGEGNLNSIFKVGDIIVTSMYSGYHVATKTEHAKILNATDVFLYKRKTDMTAKNSYDAKSFIPGYNYLLIKEEIIKEITTTAGIVVKTDTKEEMSKNDAVTKIVEVEKIGKILSEQTGISIDKLETDIKKKDKIIIDSFVGIQMNQMDTNSKFIYKIMYIFDVLAFINK